MSNNLLFLINTETLDGSFFFKPTLSHASTKKVVKGFISNINLIRLRQRCNDIKDVNKGFIKAVIFIDLKNAYNTVDIAHYLIN